MNHPTVNGIAYSSIFLSVSLFSSEQNCLVFSKDVDLLDAAVNLFARLNEERSRACDKDLLAKLVLTLLILGVSNVAELILSKDCN